MAKKKDKKKSEKQKVEKLPKCPLCELRTLEYEKIETNLGETHAWVCSECPAIVFEYVDSKDAHNLHKRLTEGVESCQNSIQQK